MRFGRFLAACGIASALTLSAGPVRAQAADPDALAAARELMELALVDQLQKQMNEQSWPPLEAVVRKAAPQMSPQQMVDLKTEYMAIADQQMAGLTAELPKIYAKYFSAAELREMLAFYRTRVGRKTLEVMPALTGELMQSLVPQMPAMALRMQEAFARVLQSKGVTLPQPPR